MTAPPANDAGLRGYPDIPDQRSGTATATAVTPAGSAVSLPAAQRQALRRQAPRGGGGPLWVRLLPSAVTACVLSIGITGPSYWRDEAATVAAVRRPAGALLRMLGQVDAVHGAYYLLIWPISVVFGTSELVLRFPSVVAMSAAAGVVAATGRRLISPAAGLAAGLIFAVVPSVSMYGQMARSYALVMLAAAAASYALVRALDHDAGRARWLCYAASLALLGVLNIFGLLLIPAHGITVLAVQGRGSGRDWLRSPGRWHRTASRRWLAAAGFAIAVTSPLLVLGYLQRDQISWVAQAGVGGLRTAVELMGPPWMSMAMLVLTAGGIAAGTARKARRRLTASADGDSWPKTAGTSGLVALCLAWLVIPPTVLLMAGALITPVYTPRYVLFCVPAGALLAGGGLAAIASIPRRLTAGLLAATVAFVLIAALGLSQQVQYRGPAGHGDDIAAADELIAASWMPGDAVYYPSAGSMALGAAYPDGLGRLRDVQVAEPAIASGTLAGTTVPMPVLRQRLARSPRFWIVQLDGVKSQGELLHGLHVRLAWTWRAADIWLQLYVPSATAYGAGYPRLQPAGAGWVIRRVS